MQTVEQLLRTLEKVQALRARAGTPGEQRAAAEAEERILARLGAAAGSRFAEERTRAREEPPVMHRFSIGDPWSRDLFFALLRRDGFAALRYPRQQRNTVRVRAPRAAMDRLWREFRKLQTTLLDEICRVSDDFIRTAASADARAAQGPFRR